MPDENEVQNDWGHTASQYTEVFESLSNAIVGLSIEDEYFKYIKRLVANALYSTGHPRANTPADILMWSRDLSLASLRFLIIEGYVELTEKGTRVITGEEVTEDVRPPRPDDNGTGQYL